MPPKVSVIMATYNHGSFVAEAIRSVVSQDFSDFEFLISDDGSTDNTNDIVGAIEDPRITFLPNAVNRGACAVTNDLIRRCSGEYIALINSDDRWMPGKLTRQVQFLDEHPDIASVFGRAQYIDQNGAPIAANTLLFGAIFDQPNRSRGEWLRRFLDEGNCLCHPTIMIRRRVYEQLGPFNNCYRQLPDFDMWIRLLKHYDLHVMESREVEFRILPGKNASAQTKANSVRGMNERFFITRTFFDGMPEQTLKQGFSDRMQNEHTQSASHLEIEKLMVLRNTSVSNDISFDLSKVYELVTLEKLHTLLEDQTTQATLFRDYHLGHSTLFEWSSTTEILRPGIANETPLSMHAWLRKIARHIIKVALAIFPQSMVARLKHHLPPALVRQIRNLL